ncbi:leucine dehydrogenase [Alteromonas macleodii str. 'Black Sea 11']|uniref:Glu/Leu/Phe/Val dehydrogenase dimerization domain-containing protein n=1 Tax=Alteromonas abrolhosensis TaxID=1892904 RepID=UPI000286E8FA|nr:Glu/Leu/Phe/Val dehydrogenase dimerization domain-containing protein [Alteromonas abrolhosensis]AFT77642.1 leucine dehydrogenase [Alteromonas macleodii str. 'Black Sea 11']NKW89831.1 Glu/Leu/Phe/Val dehydrogenase [Alteromonadaceae bacterium A_SAG4]NKX04685.1 Glu/Leu/Phe/Val dehydrogenase [Alteromonadaceae bacterium A_SAG6]NKX33132.1 Glu/Leu/Phe/Val dehydrogenase [Alteromonadaceae bacterium A_SAG3]NKX69765.1 Glu/Leu/Phe/Val dehydrogenase [Alteromonadaceae bacterium A_SAG7]
MSVFDHPEFNNHEHVAFYHDEKAGLSAIIAVHNTNLGPALGGCRMWPYVNSSEALTDVLRLSKGMTYKAAMANLELGGGKSVIIGDPRKAKTPEMMKAMGKFVESLGGKYFTAEDSGISVTDLQTMATESDYIAGIHAKYHYAGEVPDGNPAPSTAYGVFVGLKATVEYGLKRSLDGVSVAIQGMGHVGYRLAKHLHEHGAKLYVADIYPEGVEKAVSEFGATAVAPEEILSLDVDVLAPCALGAAINDLSLPEIKAKVIAGAANNQLAREDIGELLQQRGILYAPDYVINAGGVIDIFHQRMESSSNEALRAHIEQIGETLKEIYTRAEQEGAATNRVANLIAEERFSLKG